MERETFWKWGALASRLPDGRALGLNVSCGVNETSFSENCFWLDGALHPLDLVHFEHQATDLRQPWRLRARDGRLDLRFDPQGSHSENVNAWIVASNFTQLFGRFSGRLVSRDGEVLALENHPGFVESHFARW